ncbi:MAG: alpha/beta hydrolase-fold protein [Bacteroidota bacterium]|nr:alpha/beta hydrolase-fold protein [Bacteroidota bacterium]
MGRRTTVPHLHKAVHVSGHAKSLDASLFKLYKMKLVRYSLRWVMVLLLLVAFKAQSQSIGTYKYTPSEVVTMYSTILKEDRKVYIHRPKLDLADTNKRFPVLYLMDGENHFELLSQYVDYLSRPDVSAVPKIIVVGIPNTKRVRDLTPTHSILNYEGKPDTTARYKSSGGSEIFLEFLKKELMPFIDNNYKTQQYNLFAGHSLGGISSINCLLTHPNMFDAYIAVSPSFWWDNEYLLKLTENKLKSSSTLNKKLFYCDGNEGGSNSFFHNGLLKFDSIIAGKKIVGLNYKYNYYPNEMHMTVPIVAYLDALRFIFKE